MSDTDQQAQQPSSTAPAPTTAWAFGLATFADTGQGSPGAVLDTWYPAPTLGRPDQDDQFDQLNQDDSGAQGQVAAVLTKLDGVDEIRGVRRAVVRTCIDDLQTAPTDSHDAWLRLHLLSTRLVTPHSINLDGIFGRLTNVVWTSAGPCAVDGFEATRMRLKAHGGQVGVYGVDKFPRMTDYVLPTGVRIADADRVRLGAHLAPGTTVMHEGFVNYNAGTLGVSMVEGRISAGVVVGDGSDIGGGASVMGTLSGGGKQVISIGQRCLVGANAGIGISLGDDCVVEAGCYVTAGTKVSMRGPDSEPRIVKAAELSGADNVLFRRNSVSGAIEAVARRGRGTELNAALHAID